MNNSGIYCIANKLNGKIYIGSSVNFDERKYEHFYKLERNKHENIYLQRSYLKYGKDAFEFKVLEYIKNVEKLTEIEQSYLDIHWDNQNNCYNILPTAGSLLGYKHSKESKLKMSKSLIGNTRWLGKHHTEATKQKLREKLKGRTRSEETKQKMRKVQRNRTWNTRGGDSDRKLKIKMFNLNDKSFIGEFNSITECCKLFDLNKTHVSSVLSKKRKHHKGYYFERCYGNEVEL